MVRSGTVAHIARRAVLAFLPSQSFLRISCDCGGWVRRAGCDGYCLVLIYPVFAMLETWSCPCFPHVRTSPLRSMQVLAVSGIVTRLLFSEAHA